MTINEAIAQVNALKPNTYDDAIKVAWLSNLDGQIYVECIRTHEGAEDIAMPLYDKDVDMDTELLVKEPYSDLYVKYMAAQIDYHNAEFGRYGNSMVMFNASLDDFYAWYTRTHMPIQPFGVWTGVR